MTTDLSPEAWAQIRHDYEHTDKPVEDICAENGISAGTLRNRMRRWNWTRRRPPIPAEGPPPAPALQIGDAADVGAQHAAPLPSPQIESVSVSEDAGAADAGDPAASGPRLQNAVARVLPAIEATVAKLGAQPMHPREMERAARVLAALTRTLRELNALLRQCPVPAAHATGGDDDMPKDQDEFRFALAHRIEAWAANRMGNAGESPQPEPPASDVGAQHAAPYPTRPA